MRKILLVEDDLALAGHWLSLLEAEGHQVVHESTADAAITVMGCEQIDLVITDLVLPDTEGEMSTFGGVTVLAYAGMHLRPTPKVLLVTGASAEARRTLPFEVLDPECTLTKPVSDDDLLAGVRALFEESEGEKRRRREEQRIAAELQRNQFAIDRANDAVYWIRQDGSLVSVNDAACAMLGYSRPVLAQMTIFDIDPQLDRELWDESWERTEPDRSVTMVRRHLRASGDSRQVELQLHRCEFDDETLICAVAGDLADLTEVEQRVVAADLRVEETERRFRDLADAAPVASWTTEADGTCSWLNRHWISYTGQPLERQLGYGWLDVVHPADREPSWEVFHSAVQERTGFQLDYRLRGQDGAYRWFRAAAAPRFDGSARFVGHVGMSFDIHETREVIDALESARIEQADLLGSYRAVQELLGSTTGVWNWKLGTDEIEYAPAWRRLIGFDGDDTGNVPNTFDAFAGRVHPDDLADLQALIRRSIDTGEPLRHEFRLRHRRGDHLWVRADAAVSRDESGRAVRMAGSTRDVTDTRVSEAKLLAFGQILEESLNEVYLFDAQSLRFLMVNKGAQDNIGFSMQELREMTPVDIKPEYDEAEFRALIAGLEARRGVRGAQLVFETTHRRRDGSLYPVDVHLHTTEYLGRDAYVAIILDRTEAQRAERQRDRILAVAADLLVVQELDSPGVISAPNWIAVTGRPLPDPDQRPWLDFHPDDRAALEEGMARLRGGEPVRGLVARLVTPDGTYQPYEWNAEPDLDERLVYIAGRRVLDSSIGLMSAVSTVIPDVLFLYDFEARRTLFSNRSLASTLGYPPDAGDVSIRELAHPEDLHLVLTLDDRLSRSADGEVVEFECRVKAVDGSWHRILTRISVYSRNGDGGPNWCVGTSTRLDELAVIRRYADELAATNADLEQFAYMASHDLKQPLRGIDNLAQWIVEDCGDLLPEQSLGHLDMLMDRIHRMEALLDDLLEFSRAGRVRSEPEPVRIEDIVEETVAVLAPPQEFSVRYEGGDLELMTSRVELEQILRNLIGNAVKHRDRDDGEIVVSATRTAIGVEITVADDGPGIPEQYHERIFEMFHTLRPADEVEGSGVGLALVRKLVEAAGGTVTVDSRAGEGATFRFGWPARVAATAGEPDPGRSVS